MKRSSKSIPSALVASAGAVLFAAWCIAHARELTVEQDGWLRFVLASFFSLLILVRGRGEQAQPSRAGSAAIFAAVPAGVLAGVAGAVFRVRQFEWIGVVLALGGCLCWARPAARRDTALAMLVLYLAHPMPSRLFGALQLAMQWLSVQGSEWLLHSFNARVWADGFVLRTGFSVFEIPAWCSGMRTATTVFILAVALGAMKRFSAWGTALLTLAALLQALALNVLRISAMVALAPVAGATAGVEFLHASAGWIVITAIVLVYVEAGIVESFVERRRARRAELNPLADRVLTDTPLSWQRLIFHWKLLGSIALLLLAAAAAAHRSRPSHRIAMLKDVAATLRDTGRIDDARRLADMIGRLAPGDLEWELATVRIMMLQEHYETALKTLDAVPDTDPGQVIQKNVLRAYSLMGLKDLDAAWAIVRTLPESVLRTDPRVNMILAEIGLRSGDPSLTARSAVVASEWAPNTGRVRSLFPFLRANREWRAIADSDIKTPFSVPDQAMSAAEAYMNLNNVPAVADLALAAARAWPDDPRVLEPLYFMAMRREQQWEARFAAHFYRCLQRITDPDAAYDLFEKCFSLVRPDLTWAAFRHLEKMDPGSPYLSLAVARYGHLWFTFARRRVGIGSATALEGIDLRWLYPLGCGLPGWNGMCALVPRGMELARTDVTPVRKAALAEAGKGFADRDSEGGLTIPMTYAYVGVLEIGGEIEEARARLDRLAREHPEECVRATVSLSEIYERRADWEQVYETLRGHENSAAPSLLPLLRLGKAMMNLRLGLGALRVARIAAARFPDSVEAAAMLATALNAGGSPEEALLIAGRQMARRSDELDMAKARALLATERFAELDAFARAALLPRVTLPPATVQHLFLPPAELSLLWHRVNTPSEREYETHAAGIREALERSESPFLRRMMELWLAAHDGGCAPADTDPDVWESCGRDPVEKATALNQLALLLCGAGRNVEAREAARRAAAALPASPELWHMLVGLSAGDPAVIARGREACPLDPDLWLAELVASIRAAGPPAEWTGDEAGRTRDWIAGEMRAAGDRFPSAAIARAGDFLFRNGLRREAGLASKASMTGASGLLPVYVLAIRCALSQGNTQDAMDKTRLAIDASIRPPPILFEKIVDLKSAGEMATDPEMVEALRNLRISDPDNPRWAQMLGYVRFKRGGWEIVDALLQMDSALNAGATNKTPYVVAAEVSRLLGNTDRAAEYLRKALAAHPDDLDLINNLVYTLAFSPEGSAEAVRMVPDLLARDPDNIQVLDTAAVVFLRAGRPADAEVLVHSLLKKAPPGTVGWFRASMYAASIALRKGRAVEADVTLREILRKAGTVPDEDVLAASRMLVEAQGLKDAPQAETGQGQSGTAEGNASP